MQVLSDFSLPFLPMKKIISSFFAVLFAAVLIAQTTFPVNGVNDPHTNYYALTHATVYTDYKTAIANATLIVKNGNVVQVGANLTVPKGAIEVDCSGKFIYPSFIELCSNYGMPDVEQKQNDPKPQFLSSTSGAFSWNEAVHPEVNAADLFSVNDNDANALRQMGFGVVLTHQQNGIMRGTGAVVLLGDGNENEEILKTDAAAAYSFNKGNSTQDYPESLMGSIALIRQTLYDAQWYATGSANETNLSLDALNQELKLPQLFFTNGVLSELRADNIANEFGMNYIIKGKGDEYKYLDLIKATNTSFIVPLNFPAAYDINDVYDASLIPLSKLKEWEYAPANCKLLQNAGINFAITSSDLKTGSDFLPNLRKAILYGMSETQALKALTYTPATLLGMQNQIGSLSAGMQANFIVTTDSVFNESSVMVMNWVGGKPYVLNETALNDVRGNYNFQFGNQRMVINLEVSGKIEAPEMNIVIDANKIPVQYTMHDKLITLSFAFPKDSSKQVYHLSGTCSGKTWSGKGTAPDGTWIDWKAEFSSAFVLTKKDSVQKTAPVLGAMLYPFEAYGWSTKPVAQTTLFKNATVWTNEDSVLLLNTDVLISNGKIQQVGKNISAPAGCTIIDATGLNLTSGIIDEHSHIAISEGVNEGTQSVTSEVRIGDVVDPTDINIYRQLAGGVTCSHLLHGSANTIGGQTQLIKLRWGYGPEQMKFQNWPGFIKFALGENVKQSNWGDVNNVRFPQTRMGVEQTLYDAFTRAHDYELSWNNYNAQLNSKTKSTTPLVAPRRDLELDALVEILNGTRHITCHSYVQSEINMLMHVADSMHFQMNTFTHILEGYKVADKMLAHHVYASNFSDWWDYKYEVYDAIPYNSYILTKVGVVTAVNSDDAEMARRLNQEAAKSILYGGLSEIEAWKLCTLNPAKMLHVDQWVGSIKAGKDADLVLWNGNPLSIYSKVLMTYVDGICFYSVKQDSVSRNFIDTERLRLIQLMADAKQNGEPTQPLQLSFQQLYDCDTMTDGNQVGTIEQ